MGHKVEKVNFFSIFIQYFQDCNVINVTCRSSVLFKQFNDEKERKN